MRYLVVLFLMILITAQPGQAAEPIPGDACTTAGATITSNNSGVGHFMVCQSGTWKSVYSYSAAGALTKIGNLTCATNEILKFNGTNWACAADAGLTALPALSSANIWVGNTSSVATAVAMSGDATLSNAGVLTITNNAVTSAKISDGAIVVADTAFVGALTEGKWCSVSSGKIVCTSNPPSLPGCSEGEGLIYTGGAWACQPQTPDAFSFTDQTNVNVSTLISSNAVTITGITGSVAVSVSGGGSPKIRINGGSWVSSGTIANGQTLEVQLTSSASNSTMLSAVVTVGGGSDQWDVTTKPACAGALVGGYCWYLGTGGASCDTVCSSHGGCDLTGSRDYAGSAGSSTNCRSVLDAVGGMSGSIQSVGGYGIGCYTALAPARDSTVTTTCTGTYSGAKRACACNY